jgi:hypothetical protein
MTMSRSPHMKHPKGTSAKVLSPAGSGSRPGTKSKHPIKTTAPMEPHKLDRVKGTKPLK